VGYPALVNDPGTASAVREAAVAYVGAERVVDLPMWFASEDFAYYTREMPGAFYGAVVTRSGDKGDAGVVYIHIEPGASFVAAGFWRPDNQFLRRWRRRMADDPETWLSMVETLASGGMPVVADEPLKRMPRGFEEHAESPLAPWLKGRSFTASRAVDDALLRQPGLTDVVLDAARIALPLLEFGWAVEDE
jgi:uncharacterized protein (TIGR02453 family)